MLYFNLLIIEYWNFHNELNRLGIHEIRPSPSPREIGNHFEKWDKEFRQKNPYESTGTPNVFALMMGQLITHDTSGFVKTQMSGSLFSFWSICTIICTTARITNNRWCEIWCAMLFQFIRSGSTARPSKFTLPTNGHTTEWPILRGSGSWLSKSNSSTKNTWRLRIQSERNKTSKHRQRYLAYKIHAVHSNRIFFQLNTVAAYFDLHPIYSQSALEAKELRSFSGGQFALKRDILVAGYLAGDSRAPQTPWLSILHSLFYRLHNLIAKNMEKMYRKAPDEFIFNNTRALVIASYEHLLYDELFPVFLGLCWNFNQTSCGGELKRFFLSSLSGTEYSQRANLTCERGSVSCGSYDSKLDASNIVEFSMAAFRSPHAQLPNDVKFYDRDYSLTGSMALSDIVDKPEMLRNNYNSFLRGMLQNPIKTDELACSGSVRNKFQENERGFGMDLCAVDVMRGRDFGIPPYIDYIQLCDGITIKRWRDLKRFFSDGHLRLLQRIYADVEDVDLLIGVSLEHKQFGSYGSVGACIVGEQFRRLKSANRFFYTFSSNPNPFTAGKQLMWTKKIDPDI